MKKIRFLSMIVLLSLLVFVFVGCGGSQSSKTTQDKTTTQSTQEKTTQEATQPETKTEPKKEIVMKMGHGADPENARHQGSLKFAELVKEKSGGRLTIEVFHSASLGTDEQMLESLRSGVAHFSAPGVGTISPLDARLNVLELPFMFKDFEKAWEVLDGPIGEELSSKLPEKGARILAFWENGFRNITNSKRPINTPDDLKGLKIRVPNWEVSVATFNALGAEVTPLAWPETYLALQTKVVDGQENPYANILGAKLFEVQKYLSITRHQYSPLPLLVSEKFWQELSDEDRQIIQSAADEAKDYQRLLVKEDEDKLLQQLKDAGMEVNVPEDMKPFQDKVQSVYDQYDSKSEGVLQKLIDATK